MPTIKLSPLLLHVCPGPLLRRAPGRISPPPSRRQIRDNCARGGSTVPRALSRGDAGEVAATGRASGGAAGGGLLHPRALAHCWRQAAAALQPKGPHQQCRSYPECQHISSGRPRLRLVLHGVPLSEQIVQAPGRVLRPGPAAAAARCSGAPPLLMRLLLQ